MLGRHFDWYHFRSPRSTLTSKRGVEMGSQFDTGISVERQHIEENLFWEAFGGEVVNFNWWAFDWWNSRLPTKEFVHPETPPSNYNQMAADGTIWIGRHCKDVVCECTKIFSGFALGLCLPAKKLDQHIGGLVQRFVGFSCFKKLELSPTRNLYEISASQIALAMSCHFQLDDSRIASLIHNFAILHMCLGGIWAPEQTKSP